MVRYIAGFLLAVGLIVVVIVLIVRGLASSPTTPKTALNLNDYINTPTTVQLTLDSRISAVSTHRDVVITVGRTDATLQVMKGYDGDVVRKKVYPMTTNAYANFLRALMFNGFTNGNDSKSARDERGQCALGTRSIYQLIDPSGNDLERYWYTSCGIGTFQGNSNAIYRLFLAQIPDYYQLTSDVHL